MILKNKKLNRLKDGSLEFYCPACNEYHTVNDSWRFNGNFEKPTFSPSISVTWGNDKLCHSFIVDGKIRYLKDCTHEFAGKTIDMEDIEEEG